MSFLKKLFLLVLAIGGALIFFELTAAGSLYFVKQPEHLFQYSYLTGYKYDPYVGFKSHYFPSHGAVSEIDEQTLVITGGSTAAGAGIADHTKRFFILLENIFAEKKGLGLKNIVNFAVPGYVSSQESNTYKNFVFPIETKSPKVLVSFTSFNEIYFYLYRALNIGDHEFSYAMDYIFRKGYPEPSSWTEKIKNTVRRSNVFTLYHALTEKDESGNPKPIQLSSEVQDDYNVRLKPVETAIVERAAKHFLTNCLSTALLAAERKTKFIVVLQPNYYYGGELTLHNNQWFDKKERLDQLIREVKFQKEGYDMFYNLVLVGLEAYRKQGLLDYRDYRDLLKSAGPVYQDPVHFNDQASFLVAEKLAEDLEKILR